MSTTNTIITRIANLRWVKTKIVIKKSNCDLKIKIVQKNNFIVIRF